MQEKKIKKQLEFLNPFGRENQEIHTVLSRV